MMTVREIALKLLSEIDLGGKYANLAVSSHVMDRLSPKDKRIVTALVYTTVEHKITYDYYIGYLAGRSLADIAPGVKNILRLGLCQLLDMRSVPGFAAVSETVKLAKNQGERAFVNGVLRRAAREKGALPLPDRKKNAARYFSVKYSYPQATVKRFIEALGEEECERLLLAFEAAKYTDLTVNTIKITPEQLRDRLIADGYSAEISKLSPVTVRLTGSCDPRELYGFAEGLFIVQDTASAVAVQALSVREGDLVVDVCSAPGGKSLAAAILSGDKAEIHSFDLHQSKLSLIESSRDRLGLASVTVAEQDATEPRPELIGRADKVICDVPCSGLGVLAKKPDLRYKDIGKVDELAALGREILERSAGYLKVGGTLVYSTCTLERRENTDTVSGFLADHPDFSAVDFCVGELESVGGELTLYPHIHGTDGFYIALIRRNR